MARRPRTGLIDCVEAADYRGNLGSQMRMTMTSAAAGTRAPYKA